MAATKDQILESISNMTVMEVVELISEMEEKFGVTAAAPVAAAAPAAAARRSVAADATDKARRLAAAAGPAPESCDGRVARPSVPYQPAHADDALRLHILRDREHLETTAVRRSRASVRPRIQEP